MTPRGLSAERSQLASSALRTVLATVVYAVVHSFLASRQAKQLAANLLSERLRNALYRPFYLAQSFITIFFLIRYIQKLPKQTFYALNGPAAVMCRFIQAGALGYATWSAFEVGFYEILGLRGLGQWLAGSINIGPEPEAQGPALSRANKLNVSGPFRVTRHPLNLAPLIVLWANPRMTSNLLAYNIVSTLYLLLGSVHEESRLVHAYGEHYKQYTEGDVPFYFPQFPAVTKSVSKL